MILDKAVIFLCLLVVYEEAKPASQPASSLSNPSIQSPTNNIYGSVIKLLYISLKWLKETFPHLW